MTDIATTAPIIARRAKLPSLKFPQFGICAAFAAMPRAIAQASAMAYVAPCQSIGHRQPEAIDAELQGRDPNW